MLGFQPVFGGPLFDTGSITGTGGNTLSVAATAPAPVAAVSLKVGNTLSVAATAPAPTAAVSLKVGNTLSVVATAPRPIAAVLLRNGLTSPVRVSLQGTTSLTVSTSPLVYAGESIHGQRVELNGQVSLSST
jgi:hypothetical protein